MTDQLPKRTADELVRDLRIRADFLEHEHWENPATAAMMHEAADLIADLSARLASLDAENTALRAQVATRIGYEVVAKDFRVIIEHEPSKP